MNNLRTTKVICRASSLDDWQTFFNSLKYQFEIHSTTSGMGKHPITGQPLPVIIMVVSIDKREEI